jgi:hypothetical protein
MAEHKNTSAETKQATTTAHTDKWPIPTEAYKQTEAYQDAAKFVKWYFAAAEWQRAFFMQQATEHAEKQNEEEKAKQYHLLEKLAGSKAELDRLRQLPFSVTLHAPTQMTVPVMPSPEQPVANPTRPDLVTVTGTISAGPFSITRS